MAIYHLEAKVISDEEAELERQNEAKNNDVEESTDLGTDKANPQVQNPVSFNNAFLEPQNLPETKPLPPLKPIKPLVPPLPNN